MVGRVLGAGGDLGVELTDDVVRLVGVDDLDARGGLQTLGDVVRARGHQLLIFVEDTDAWAMSDLDAEELPRQFFSQVLRPLVSDTDVAVAVAVQTAWETFEEFAELRERAVVVAEMPAARSQEEAERMMRAVLGRRMERALDACHPVHAAFTDAAIEMLGHEALKSRGFRSPLALVRDAFDRHADALPDRIDRTNLLDTL